MNNFISVTALYPDSTVVCEREIENPKLAGHFYCLTRVEFIRTKNEACRVYCSSKSNESQAKDTPNHCRFDFFHEIRNLNIFLSTWICDVRKKRVTVLTDSVITANKARKYFQKNSKIACFVLFHNSCCNLDTGQIFMSNFDNTYIHTPRSKSLEAPVDYSGCIYMVSNIRFALIKYTFVIDRLGIFFIDVRII